MSHYKKNEPVTLVKIHLIFSFSFLVLKIPRQKHRILRHSLLFFCLSLLFSLSYSFFISLSISRLPFSRSFCQFLKSVSGTLVLSQKFHFLFIFLKNFIFSMKFVHENEKKAMQNLSMGENAKLIKMLWKK